jgi:hypothetical protein
MGHVSIPLIDMSSFSILKKCGIDDEAMLGAYPCYMHKSEAKKKAKINIACNFYISI